MPEAIAVAAAARGLRVVQAAPLGCHPALVQLARQRRAEAVADIPPCPAADTALVWIGRGSSDPTALSQLDRFATIALKGDSLPGHPGYGFVAAVRPMLAEALELAADPSRSGLRRISLQPHVLFRGHVEERVTAAVNEARRRHAGFQWVQVPRFGADRLVAEAIAARVCETCPIRETAVLRG